MPPGEINGGMAQYFQHVALAADVAYTVVAVGSWFWIFKKIKPTAGQPVYLIQTRERSPHRRGLTIPTCITARVQCRQMDRRIARDIICESTIFSLRD